MTEFKVGDHVRVIRPGTHCGDPASDPPPVGTSGVINWIDRNAPSVTICISPGHWLDPDCLAHLHPLPNLSDVASVDAWLSEPLK